MDAQALRIITNIDVLLKVGTFSGDVAPQLAEAQALITKMIADMTPPAKEEGTDGEPSKETT